MLSLVNMAAVRRSVMLRRVAVMLVVLLAATSLIVSAGPAQTVLQDLAETERSERTLSGYLMIGAGIVVGLALGAVLASVAGPDSGAALLGVGIGAAFALPGIISLAVPSKAEREYSVAGSSEARSLVALQRLASEGRNGRLISGIVDGAIAVASLLSPYYFPTSYDYLYATAFYGGMAGYNFLVPSREEQALQRYSELAAAGQTP
jgi:hypothetical protein